MFMFIRNQNRVRIDLNQNLQHTFTPATRIDYIAIRKSFDLNNSQPCSTSLQICK